MYFRIPKEDADEIVHFEHQEHEVCSALLHLIRININDSTLQCA